MREIKFRAWDSVSKKMVYFELNGRNPNAFMDSGYIYLRFPTSIANISAHGIKLMQYTGLHDKNGQEIHEGDICKYSYINPMTREERTFVWKVEWSNGAYWLLSIDDSSQDTLLWIQHKEIEVIGNIYENPELLKKEAWSMK